MNAMQIAGENRGVLVVDMVDVFIRNQTSLQTQKAYRYDLRNWFEWLGGTEIVPSVKDAIDFREFIEQKFNSRTAQRIFNTCRVFYRFLGGFNPFQALKSPKTTRNRTPEVADDAVVEKMLEICDNPRDKFVLTLLLNGLRLSEVAGLRKDSFFWSPQYGCDIIKVVGKGEKERLVPANRNTSLAARGAPESTNEWLLGSNNAREVEYICEKWTRAAGKKYSPHKLRHHYATRLIRNGVNVFQLSRLLGHESVSTTQIYVNLDLTDAVKAAMLDPMNLELVDGESA